jgi:hypothetical protein
VWIICAKTGPKTGHCFRNLDKVAAMLVPFGNTIQIREKHRLPSSAIVDKQTQSPSLKAIRRDDEGTERGDATLADLAAAFALGR